MPTLSPTHAARRHILLEGLIWSGPLACLLGLVAHRSWQVLPWGRFGESLLLAGLVALVAWPLRAWRQWPWAYALAAVWLLVFVALTGPVPALAGVLLFVAAMAFGSRLAGTGHPVLAVSSGLAVLSAVLGWLISLPVHRWWVYLPALLLVVYLGRGALRLQAAQCAAAWRDAVAASPRAAGWAVVALGLGSAAAWLPTMQYDDLAYHLGLPWQLLVNGRYALDPTHQVWALAPWAGDVLQAVAQVVSGAEARSAVNLGWLLATAAGLWQVGALVGLQPWARWATLALFATLPMTAGLLGGMQTEGPATAAMVALAVVVLDPTVKRRLLVASLLFGLLVALKPLHGIAAAPLLAWGVARGIGRGAGPGGWALALLSMLVVALPSYAQAWWVSGNPVLPLFNGWFESGYFPAVDFDDPRWQAGLSPLLPWQLTFDTDRYLEGWDGGAGFVLIALAGAWLAGLLERRGRGLAICAGLAVVLPLLPLQYARYVHPGMVLLLPAAALAVQAWLVPRRAAALLVGLCVLDLAFQANAQWLLHTGGVKRSLLGLGNDTALFEERAPERVLIARIREQAPPDAVVLLLSNPFHAELAGRGRTVDWYAPVLKADAARADQDPSGAEWQALLRRHRISEVVLDPATTSPARHAGLQRAGAAPRASAAPLEWWHVPGRSGSE